jgi:predicted RNase H-like HicB family nuclease
VKLRIHLEKDDSGYYVAECPALPGCVTQGKTVREATSNMREAISCWLQAANDKAGKSRKGKRIHRQVEL